MWSIFLFEGGAERILFYKLVYIYIYIYMCTFMRVVNIDDIVPCY